MHTQLMDKQGIDAVHNLTGLWLFGATLLFPWLYGNHNHNGHYDEHNDQRTAYELSGALLVLFGLHQGCGAALHVVH